MTQRQQPLRVLRKAFGAGALLAFFLAGASAVSAQPDRVRYQVSGTVFSAARLAPGEPVPENPLSDPDLWFTTDPNASLGTQRLIPKTVGPENHYAVAPRSLVRLQLLDAETRQPLGQEARVELDGRFQAEFSEPPTLILDPDPGLTIGVAPPRVPERRVRVAVRDAASGALLLESDPVVIFAGSNERWVLVPGEPLELGQASPAGGTNTFLFTRVGKIPVDSIQQGRAHVSTADAGKWRIPAYQGAPFGGNLFLFGGFSRDFYPVGGNTGSYCYQVLIDGQALDAPLYKTKYTVPQNGPVKTERVLLGPDPTWGVPNCYGLTPLSTAADEFWSYPDLLALWPTGAQHGERTISVKLFKNGQPFALTSNQYSTLTLQLDNHPVDLRFDKIELPGSGGGTINLLDQGNRCKIARLSQGDDLTVGFTASHPFLKGWGLSIRSNRGDSALSESGSSSGSTTRTVAGSRFPVSCAYAFSLSATAKTTDGYHYLYRAHRLQTYYLQVP